VPHLIPTMILASPPPSATVTAGAMSPQIADGFAALLAALGLTVPAPGSGELPERPDTAPMTGAVFEDMHADNDPETDTQDLILPDAALSTVVAALEPPRPGEQPAPSSPDGMAMASSVVEGAGKGTASPPDAASSVVAPGAVVPAVRTGTAPVDPAPESAAPAVPSRTSGKNVTAAVSAPSPEIPRDGPVVAPAGQPEDVPVRARGKTDDVSPVSPSWRMPPPLADMAAVATPGSMPPATAEPPAAGNAAALPMPGGAAAVPGAPSLRGLPSVALRPADGEQRDPAIPAGQTPAEESSAADRGHDPAVVRPESSGTARPEVAVAHHEVADRPGPVVAPAPAAPSAPGATGQQHAAPPQEAARAAPAVAPPPPAQIAQAAVPFLAGLRPGQAGRIAVRLDPADLGQVEVRVEPAHGGHARIEILVERADTMLLLQRDQQDLMRALDRAGLTTGEPLSFAFAGGSGAERQAADQRAPGQASRAPSFNGSRDEDVPPRAAARPVHRAAGRLDLIA